MSAFAGVAAVVYTHTCGEPVSLDYPAYDDPELGDLADWFYDGEDDDAYAAFAEEYDEDERETWA